MRPCFGVKKLNKTKMFLCMVNISLTLNEISFVHFTGQLITFVEMIVIYHNIKLCSEMVLVSFNSLTKADLLQKMLAARKAVTFTSSLTGRNALQFRTTVISGPPRNRIPFSVSASFISSLPVGFICP